MLFKTANKLYSSILMGVCLCLLVFLTVNFGRRVAFSSVWTQCDRYSVTQPGLCPELWTLSGMRPAPAHPSSLVLELAFLDV